MAKKKNRNKETFEKVHLEKEQRKKEEKAKELDSRQGKKAYVDSKALLVKYIKRYGLILLISAPLIMIFNYVMSREVSWWNNTLAILSTLVLMLLACLIGLVIFTKKDDKENREMTKEKERDPFAD